MAEHTPGNVGLDSVVDSGELSGTLNVHLLKERLSQAEVLLSYAVETGVQVDPVVSRSILEAGTASRTGWTEHTATNLLTAEATLAAILKPVSAESLHNCALYRSKPLRRRLLLPVTMFILATVIVLYSTAAVLFSSFSAGIRTNLDVANPLAVRLVGELGAPAQPPDKRLCLNSNPPAAPSQGATNGDPSKIPEGVDRKDVIQDLQTLAAAIRDMYGGARRMNQLYRFQPDPITFNRSTTAAEIT